MTQLKPMELPAVYTKLSAYSKRMVRNRYVKMQDNLCMYCKGDLNEDPPKHVTDKPIVWKYFPKGFLDHPVHLQHDHKTGLTEGAVHAYCNAVLWQYHKR